VGRLIDDADLDDQTFTQLSTRFGDAQLLEFIAVVGTYRTIASVMRVARLPLDAGARGWPSSHS
jgi:hypothetical protein